MGGRHRTAAETDALRPRGFAGHRQRRGLRSRALVVPAILLVLTAGTATALAARTGALGCLGSQTKLRVVASPDVAPALDKVAQRFRDGEIGAAGRCVDLTVTGRDSQQVVEEFASAGQGTPRSGAMDIWVPDSSVYVEAARSAQQNPDRLRPAGSVAHSPVVVAMIRPLADQLAVGADRADLDPVFTQAAGRPAESNSALQLGVVDPARSRGEHVGAGGHPQRDREAGRRGNPDRRDTRR